MRRVAALREHSDRGASAKSSRPRQRKVVFLRALSRTRQSRRDAAAPASQAAYGVSRLSREVFSG